MALLSFGRRQEDMQYIFPGKIYNPPLVVSTTLHHSIAAFHHKNFSSTKNFVNLILQSAKTTSKMKKL